MKEKIYNKFDKTFEERMIKKYYQFCLEDIRNYKQFPLEEVRTRRRSTTLRDGFLLLNTHTISIL